MNLYDLSHPSKKKKQQLAMESRLAEFAPSGGDDGGPDEDEILFKLAKQWWLGSEQDMIRAERTLASMGWEIGEDEGSYDDGGVFVVRAGDVNGRSYQSWPHEELSLDEAAPGWLRHTAGAATGALAGVGASFPGAAIAGPIGGAVAGAYGAKAGYDLGAGAADWVYDKVTGKKVPADKAAVDEDLTMKHQRDHTTQRRPDISNSLADRDFDMSEKPNVAKSADGHPTVKWRHHGHAGHTRVEPTLKPTTVQRKDTRPIPSFLKKGVAEGSSNTDVKKQISKFEELALAANRAGDDAKCKQYQQKIQALKQKMSQGVAEATGDEKFDTMMGQIQREPKYPDSQMPPTDVKDLYQWAIKNNKPYHKIFAEWANREGYKSVAPALQRAGDLDTEALDYWTPRVWKIYWGEVRGIDSEMPPEWSKKRVPDELRDYLETVFDAYDNIVFDWPTEYRQIGGQGNYAEGMAEGGYQHGFADPNAPSLGGSRRKDDEGNSEFDDRQRRQTGMIFYNVDDVETAQQLGLKQTRRGKWYLRTGNRHAQQTADRAFGLGRIWYPKNETVESEELGELSNELLGDYKRELGIRASAADRAGDFDKGHEYFKKINRATIRQGENDARRHAEKEKENDVMETRLNMMRKAGYDL